MRQFKSQLPKATLDANYRALYSKGPIRKRWNKAKTDFPRLSTLIPEGFDIYDLLTAPFEELAELYFRYESLKNELTGDELELMKTAVEPVFVYNEYYANRIKGFFLNPDNQFSFYTCVYCDTEEVGVFTRSDGRKVRKFHTEHILDKGHCPLLSLSLYNFCPSCPTCNGPEVKGTMTIGDTLEEVKLLSPTHPAYNYIDTFHFKIVPKGDDVEMMNMMNHKEDYLVDINFENPLFEKSANLFQLITRYNEGEAKSKALCWKDKRINNPDDQIAIMARETGKTFEEVYESLFELNASHNDHWTYDKLRQDMITWNPE